MAKMLICEISIPDFYNQFYQLLIGAGITIENLSSIINSGIIASSILFLLFQILVGYLAKREGKREEVKGTLCVVMAIILFVFELPIITYDIYLLIYAFNSIFIVALILDVICFISIIQIIYATLKNKYLIKKRDK